MLVAEKLQESLVMSTIESPEDITIRQLEAIKSRAIQLWGSEKWLAELVKAYSKIVKANTTNGQYSVVKRIFETHTCHIKTLNSLLLAVNCRFQMVCYEAPKIIEM